MDLKPEFNNITESKKLLKNLGFDETEISKILSVNKYYTLSKGDIFLNEGKKSDIVGLLLKGMLFAYSLNKLGDKNISRFFYLPENLIVVNYESFNRNSKSEETIECFENAILIIINKSDLNSLYNEIPRLNIIVRQLAEESYIKALQKIKILQAQNAKERIKNLQKLSPILFQKLPKSYIASYLGMHRNTYNKAIIFK